MGVSYSHYIIPRDNTFRPAPQEIIALIAAWKRAGYILEKAPVPVFKVDAWEQEYWEALKEKAAKRSSASWLSRAFGKKERPLRYSDICKTFSYPPEGDSLAALSSSGAMIQWPATDYLSIGTVYPLDTLPDPSRRPSYSLEIELCDDFTNLDLGGYIPCRELSTLCACGRDLQYETVGILFDEHRIHKNCPSCGASFRPQDQIVEIADGATGAKYEERGGLCYRFAIVVSCGKEMPSAETDGRPRDPNAHPAFMETCRTALGIDLYEVSHYS